MIRMIGLPLLVVVAVVWATGSTDSMGTTSDRVDRTPVSRSLQAGTPTANGCDIASELPALHFILEPESGGTQNPDLIVDAWLTLTTRIGELGTEPSHDLIARSASVVDPPSNNQIKVSLRRIEDHVRAEQLLAEVGHFEIVDPGPIPLQIGDDIQTPVANDEATPGTIVDSHDIDRQVVHLVRDADGQLVVVFKLNNASGGDKYAKFIDGNLGQPIPVVVDDRVIAAPTVIATYPAGFGMVTGLDELDASILAIELTSGPLPIPLNVVGRVPVSAAELCYG